MGVIVQLGDSQCLGVKCDRMDFSNGEGDGEDGCNSIV